MFSLNENGFQSMESMLCISQRMYSSIAEEFKFSPYLHEPCWYPGTLPCLSVFRGLCSARERPSSHSTACYVVYDPTQAAVENAFFLFTV